MPETSDQVEKKVPNPTGKGGFGERPEDINRSGNWDSTMSISYQYKRFLKMDVEELKAFKALPDSKKTVAMEIAYAQVIKARGSLNHAKEVTDRTEGKAQQNVDMTSKGDKIATPSIIIAKQIQEIIDAEDETSNKETR